MTQDQTERFTRIASALNDIRPMLQNDGGDVELVALEDHRVKVRLTGACLSCGLAGQTLGAIRRHLLTVVEGPLLVVPYTGAD